ncbi:unnamed protein product [Rotaria magnacalcarata]|nr:unnamed protein product [Rotaria magnacalcarata]
MVLWHCDTIHAVDSIHRGQSDSSVFYIPAVPLCEMNVKYLVQQRDAFLQGIPPPDFPGGEGESHHIGRGTHEELIQLIGGRSMGFELFSIKSDMQLGEKQVTTRANTILNL